MQINTDNFYCLRDSMGMPDFGSGHELLYSNIFTQPLCRRCSSCLCCYYIAMYPLLQDSNTVTHWQRVASKSSLCDLKDNLWEPGDLLWQGWLGWDGIYYWYWCRHRLWQGWLGWQWALAIASIYLWLEEHMLPRFNSEKRWSNILQPNHTILRDKLQICVKIIAYMPVEDR